MDHLDNVVNKIRQGSPLPNEQQPSASGYDDPNHPIWELWQRMGEIYGHQWASQQGDEPNDTWCQGLADLTPQQFAVGLRALLDRESAWPPNLVEFRQLCTGRDESAWERQCHKPFRPDRALEDKTGWEKRRAANIDALAKLREETGI